MKTSVIIPAYNAGKFLGEALKSVVAQTFRPEEVIVVDDGSTDNTAEMAKGFPGIKYLYQQNQGTAAALNSGIKIAKGDVLSFLDADDVWMPEKLEKQTAILKNENSIDMTFTWIENFACQTMNTPLKEKIVFESKPMIGIQKSTMVIKKKAFLKVGLFMTETRLELLHWYALAKELGLKEKIINEVLVRRRIHGTNQNLLHGEMKSEFPKIIKTILDRRRSMQ